MLLYAIQILCFYTLFYTLYKTIASLSHGNSAPENGFSIEALRMLSDVILSHGSIFDVPVTKDLLESVTLAK